MSYSTPDAAPERGTAYPPDMTRLDQSHPMVDQIRKMLEGAHARNAAAPIKLPDEQGAFPPSPLSGRMLGHGVPPIVADANTLRNDIIYSCRHGCRTTLVNAANAGALRIYCATHVVGEVFEHARRWTTEAGDVSLDDFLKRWITSYLPLIHEVGDEDIPFEVLAPAEILRISELADRDCDDVPSAVLALALRAFFLSEDCDALCAVYGPEFNVDGHRAWLEVLMAGGDAAELSSFMFGFSMLPTLAGAALFQLGRWLADTFSPFLIIALGILGVVLGAQVPAETRSKIGSAFGHVVNAFGYALVLHEIAYTRFQRAAPTVPSWHELALRNEKRMVLARACIHGLARSSATPLSAEELAKALPDTGVGQGEHLVRETLRRLACFDEPYRGRWQLGHVPSVLRLRRTESTPLEAQVQLPAGADSARW
ncbi:MAG TPA: hypothetical protein VKU89_03875 [Solirubrobacteraceae bacterium]|nr:hypothetical protein [Solirubrobacteraceae bacterium]